jgi:hypothetical protein
MEIDAWLAPFRRYWSTHLDALERHLDRMSQPPSQEEKEEMSNRDKYQPGRPRAPKCTRMARTGLSC